MHPTKFRLIWPNGFRGEEFLKSANQKQELPMAAMFVNGSGRNEQSLQRTAYKCFLASFGSFGQTVSEEKNLKNQPIRNKSCLWRPCLSTDSDQINNLYRGPSIDASHQFRFIWPSDFRGEDFFKSANQKQELPVVSMFVNRSRGNEQSL